MRDFVKTNIVAVCIFELIKNNKMKIALAPIATKTSRVLILGTMPGEQSLLQQQYYANKGNHFWRILFQVFNEEFSTDYEIRKKLILKNNLALWDVLYSCEREGSLDSKIKNEIPNDFSEFLQNHPKISTIVFSSKAAAAYFKKYVSPLPHLQYFTLPSPSGANARLTLAQKIELWLELHSFLL